MLICYIIQRNITSSLFLVSFNQTPFCHQNISLIKAYQDITIKNLNLILIIYNERTNKIIIRKLH